MTNEFQDALDDLHQFTSSKQMKVKETKTELMKFNFSSSYDFPPELKINGFTQNIKVTKETKLLGVMITDDLKWESNTAYRKIWI